jgi:hypothetical protein
MSGGWEGFGGNSDNPPWGDSHVGRLLPTEDITSGYRFTGKTVIDEPDHEFVGSLEWNPKEAGFMHLWEHNVVKVRPGADMLAHLDVEGLHFDPLMITWDLVDGGRVFALTGHLAYMPWIDPPWDYYGDFLINLMIYVVRRPVPQDLPLVHGVRLSMFNVATRRAMLFDLLEFVEKFGANTEVMMPSIDALMEIEEDARQAYLEFHFTKASDMYSTMFDEFDLLDVEALRLRDRALVWVFVIEWLAISGTAMATGYILWTIMVRRRLYRKVEATKFM